MIYVIREVDAPGKIEYVKIGFTVDPVKRLSTLQGGNPRELWMIAAFEGGRDLEQMIHQDLKARGCWVRGEWFKRFGGGRGRRRGDILDVVERAGKTTW